MVDFGTLRGFSAMGGNIALIVVVIVLVIIALILKGIALWKAAGLKHKKWFIALFIINTFGILEIIYLYFVARKHEVEVIEKNE